MSVSEILDELRKKEVSLSIVDEKLVLRGDDDALNPLGLDKEDPASEDDITTLNQLHLPLGRVALIALSSKDVIHSFFLPEFRVKQDAIPGMRVPVSFTPTLSTATM